jgi:hypothetical protein
MGYSVLTAGPVPDSCRRYPTGPVVFVPTLIERAGVLALFLRRDPGRGREGFEDP